MALIVAAALAACDQHKAIPTAQPPAAVGAPAAAPAASPAPVAAAPVADAAAPTASNVLFILDGSGSMQERVDGQPKIITAKKAMTDILRDLPAATRIGFMTYGTQRKGDCGDITLISPVGSQNAAAISDQVNRIAPKGETPIAGALAKAGDVLKGAAGPKMIVLVTDGAEECHGDPCAAAAQLASQDVDLHINVVGFNLGARQRAAVQCVADKGHGRYFDAKDAKALTTAFAAVETEVKDGPAPPTVYQAAYSDTFQGSALRPEWVVLNPNKANYAVDGGKLLLVTKAAGGLKLASQPNVFRLNRPLPAGDWVATIKLGGQFQTLSELFEFGVMDDAANFVAADLTASNYVSNASLSWGAEKTSGGSSTGASAGPKMLGPWPNELALVKAVQPIALRLAKTGHTFTSAINLAGEKDKTGKPVWTAGGEVTALQTPKALVFTGAQTAAAAAETTFEIYSVTIDQAKH